MGVRKPAFVAVRPQIVQLSPPPSLPLSSLGHCCGTRGVWVEGVRPPGPPNSRFCVAGSLSAFVYQHAITPLALPCKLSIPTRGRCPGQGRCSERSLPPVWGGGHGPAGRRGLNHPGAPATGLIALAVGGGETCKS